MSKLKIIIQGWAVLPVFLFYTEFLYGRLYGILGNHVDNTLTTICRVLEETLGHLMVSVLVWLIIRISFKEITRKFFLCKNFKLYFFTILTLTFWIFAYQKISSLFPKEYLDSFDESLFQKPHIIIATLIVAPIFEEIIFRGLVLEKLLTRLSPIWAILHSSLIFGIVHINLVSIVNAILIGLLLGWVYFRTKSILICMILHFLVNLISINLPDVDYFFQKNFNNDSCFMFIMVCLVGIVLCIVGLKNYFQKENEQTNAQTPSL
ncbi:MAG: CPBP family intramembrane glutamic endopeptidase [Thermonemataceae bacterium]|nr:CPBP family intramembrane glutamic endopeptidase [Thermonemataceae bacterium]